MCTMCGGTRTCSARSSARAAADGLSAFHVCDWRTPTEDLLNDRGLMGEGCIDVRQIRGWVEDAGFDGFIEVEVFSDRYWATDQQAFLEKIKRRLLAPVPESTMKMQTIGIIMHGVTGRMGTNQHLVRSILAIRQQGGIRIGSDEVLMPDPILVGRNAAKLKGLAEAHQIKHYTTDLDQALADRRYPVYFDALTTPLRPANVRKAIAAGKHIYTRKADRLYVSDALALYRDAVQAGVKHGVVQDKLWLPGLLKLRQLIDSGFFGTILSVRGEFGYWVFDGFDQPCQRPSWNYRKEQGGSILIDMFCHWRYLIDNLFGPIAALVVTAATHIPPPRRRTGPAVRLHGRRLGLCHPATATAVCPSR